MKYSKRTITPVTATTNLAGGPAYSQSPKLEFASLLLTNFMQDQFYRKEETVLKTLRELIAKVGPEFAAKAALYARNEYGMRSVSHVVAAELAASVKTKEWTKLFYATIVHRPDDMVEICAYYLKTYGKPLPNSLKKGLALAFGKFDAYQLAKYRAEGHDLSLIDVANMVHPKPTERNKDALAALMKGELRSTETWEAKLSQAGQDAESEAEKGELKGAAWQELLESKKLGYFALLRNLRNISQQAPECVPIACEQLKNEEAICKSLVLPFRFLSAGEALDKRLSATRQLLAALDDAINLSFANVPRYEGKTVVVLDGSGSMTSKPTHKSTMSCMRIGSLFAAALAKANDADIILFSDDASYVAYNPRDSMVTIAEMLARSAKASGTNFHAPFGIMKPGYARIIILSDEQGWMGSGTPTQDLARYRSATPACKLFSFDLAGYGTMQFPERDVYALAGFSEKTFDLLRLLEKDKQALVHVIEAVPLPTR